MSDSNGTGNTARGLTVAIALFFAWALLAYAVRAWVKLKKRDSWGLDDTSVSISLVVIIVRIGVVTNAVHHGFGNPWSSLSDADRQSANELLYASQILYVLAIGLIKVSTSLFAARFLTRDKSRVRIAHVTTALCVVWTIVSILVIAIRPNLSDPWDTRDGTESLFARWLAIEVVGVAIELGAIALSIHFVWGLHMSIPKRMSIAMLFGCRLLVTPVIALRLWELSPSENPNSDKPAVTAYIFTEAVLEFTFILASATCLKPFVRPFHSGFVATPTPAYGYASGLKNSALKNSALKNSKGDVQMELSVAKSNGGDGDGTVIVTRRDRDSHGNNKSATTTRTYAVDHDDEISLANSPPSHNTSRGTSILKTQAWTVSYEGSEEPRQGARQ